MFRRCFFLLAAVISVCTFCGVSTAQAEISIIDDFGNKVVMRAPAKRIVALYGSFNEVLYAMNLGHRLVGRTAADHYPPQIVTLPSIGTHMRPNPELIVALKPDLVLQMAGRLQAATALDPIKARGIPAAMFKVASFDELFSMIYRIGVLTGEVDSAENLVDSMTRRLEKVTEKCSTVSGKRFVFFEVRYPNLLAAGQGSIVADIIRKAGGINCVVNSKKIVRMGEEELLRIDPEYYVYQTGRMNQSPVKPNERAHFKMIKAVRTNKILQVDESVFSRPGPRNVEAVEILADFLLNSNKEK
ncbi:ABC transporter substrate-binding protein [Maridesulfovibrio hydrothermalis]|uniref:ABC transporter substrate-binding protein n=1 Tax=Maridesulfovibrio hydrothermalis TaxID=191026 RepID=UPI0003147E49|nr:ABC transporter substrate-binding protein [Maridesulfovibrio hydrothermalis]